MSIMASSPSLLFPRKSDMKIASFYRDTENRVVAVGEDGFEVILPPEWIAANKPDVGSEYQDEATEESVVEEPKAE